MTTPLALRKWLAFGHGVGIEIAGPPGSETLHVLAVRVRPTGARVLGSLSIPNFLEQPAAVWGAEFGAFLRKLGLRHVAAAVLLPRRDLMVRQLSLPGVSDQDLASAVSFQMEGLHPYAEEDVQASWARLPGRSTVLVAIARRAIVERYSTVFAEAGVKAGSFTCSAAAIHAALRLFGNPPAAEMLAYAGGGESGAGPVEFYGESPARPLFSAAFEPGERDGFARLAALACSELRLPPQTEPRPLDQILSASPVLPYVAALASACPRLMGAVNLLPADERQTSSRVLWIPSAALGAMVLLLAGALAASPGVENRRYLRTLQTEIARVQPAASRAGALDREIDQTRRRTLMLDEVRRRTRLDMDVLGELTRILPPPAWLNYFEVSRTQVIIGGETDQAAPLLKSIDASPLFESSEFVMPPARIQNGEMFRIRTNREAGK